MSQRLIQDLVKHKDLYPRESGTWSRPEDVYLQSEYAIQLRNIGRHHVQKNQVLRGTKDSSKHC